MAGVVGRQLQPHQLRAAANDRQRAANLMDDPREESSHLDEMLVQDGDRRELSELDQPAHPRQDDRRDGVLGDVVVGPGLQAGEDVGVVVANREHQHGDAGGLGVGLERAADVVADQVGKVHVEHDRVRTNLLRPRDGLAPARSFVDAKPCASQDRPKEHAIRRAVVHDQNGAHPLPLSACSRRSRSVGETGRSLRPNSWAGSVTFPRDYHTGADDPLPTSSRRDSQSPPIRRAVFAR